MEEPCVSEPSRGCDHAGSVDLERVRKCVKFVRYLECRQCSQTGAGKKKSPSALRTCLGCGISFCITHSESHHSLNPSHSLCTSDACTVTCLSCRSSLPAPLPPLLSRILDLVRPKIFTNVTSSPEKSPQRPSETKKPSRERNPQEVETKTTLEKVKGLRNVGNSCFFNSVVQCLSHTVPLCDLMSPEVLATSGTSPVTSALFEVMRSMVGNGAATINPSELFGAMCKRVPRFRTRQQQDAHELYITLVDSMIAEEKAASSTRVRDIFEGEVVSRVSCHECGGVSLTAEKFLNLTLPIASASPPPRLRVPEVGSPGASGRRATADDLFDQSQLRQERQAGAGGLSNHQRKKMQRRGARGPPKKGTVSRTQARRAAAAVREATPEDQADSKSEETPQVAPGSEPAQASSDAPLDEGAAPQASAEGLSEPAADVATVVPDAVAPVAAERRDEPAPVAPAADDAVASSEAEPSSSSSSSQVAQASLQMSALRLAEPVPDIRAVAPSKSERGSLEQCLDAFTSPELLAGRELYHCPRCCSSSSSKRREGCEATKQLAIRKLPRVLVVQLKRFTQTSKGRLEKVSDHVSLPLVLSPSSLLRFCESRSPAASDLSPDSDLLTCYVLYGVSEHGGSLHGGHYTAHVAALPETPGGPREWYFASDTRVSKSGPSDAVSSCAYLAFYERVTKTRRSSPE